MMRLTLLSAALLLSTAAYTQDLTNARGNIIERSLSESWALTPEAQRGTLRLTSYKPFYLTAGRWTNDPNEQPSSENPAYSVPEARAYNNYEARFQLSFKTKVLQDFLFGTGDLWVGYTQYAHWQIYNTALSRPFRELNYEPEIMVNFPINARLFGLDLKMAGASFNHQSNGRDLPRSRSWNRVIFNLAMEGKNIRIHLKPWIRLPDADDENPLITSFIGRGEAIVVYRAGKHIAYAVGTNTLTLKQNRGGLQLNYLYPVKANLRLQAQFFTGYGETLIDYNHRQTTIGLGVSFVDW